MTFSVKLPAFLISFNIISYVSIGAISKAFLTFFPYNAKNLNEGFSYRKHIATSEDSEFSVGPLFHLLNLFQNVSLSRLGIAHIICLIPLKNENHNIPSFA